MAVYYCQLRLSNRRLAVPRRGSKTPSPDSQSANVLLLLVLVFDKPDQSKVVLVHLPARGS
jgi:hypothetical protein